MRKLTVLLAATALLAGALLASSAAGATATRPRPAWLSPALHERILAAGARGVRVDAERLDLQCPGVGPRGVSAGGCIVDPAGCTADFIFTDGSSQYVGTARHCVNKVGDRLVMQVDPLTLAAVGTVVKITPGGGEPGQDFALVRIDPDVVAKWGVSPAVPLIGGPNGIYEGCDPQVVKIYGHGYAVTVAQGKPELGLATNWVGSGYGFTGVGLPGDSGAPVLLADGRAAGNFTHILVDLANYPGSNLAGMRIGAILSFAGVRLVNADGTTSGPRAPACSSRAGGLLGL